MQGLFNPDDEKDSCGVGFIGELDGQQKRSVVADALNMLIRMAHRGACGCETNTGDGAGILVGASSILRVSFPNNRESSRHNRHISALCSSDIG